MKISKLSFFVIAFLSFMFAKANDFLNIPCAEYKNGASWNTLTKSKGIKTETTSTVKSINENKILLTDTVKNSTNGMNTEHSRISILRREDGTVYLDGQESNIQGMSTQTTNATSLPICGKVPKEFSYTSSIKNPYNTTKMKYTVKIKKIGNKKINVPAGEFETSVYQKKTKLDMLGMQNAAQSELVSIEYISDKIGVVKSELMSTIILPQTASKVQPKKIKSNSVTELITYK